MSSLPHHEKISPTAKLVAYWRQFSDIPYSKDIASLFKAEDALKQFCKDTEWLKAQHNVLAALLELRYKAISHQVKSLNATQVLEFASGISLRGLTMTDDPNLLYVETDLPTVTEEKTKTVRLLMDKYKIEERSNLFFYNANILNFDEIEESLKHFNQHKPLIIVNEGLFQYLSKDEKRIASQNIYEILRRFKGVWLTPDFDVKNNHLQKVDPQQFENIINDIQQVTGRCFDVNAFEDDNEVVDFFTALGFKITWIPQLNESITLTSLHHVSIPPELQQALRDVRLWMLSVAC